MSHSRKLTFDQANVIRQLLAAGRRRCDLARAFGVSETLITHIKKGAAYAWVPCEGCDAAISPQRVSRLCEGCKAQQCCQCKGAKSPTRRSPRCAACDREKHDRYLKTREPRCRECGVSIPDTRRDALCSDCRTETTRIHREFRQARAARLSCKQCGGKLPTCKSWTRNLCLDCARTHDQRRRSLSRRLCGYCARPLADTNKSALCKECAAVDYRIRSRGTAQTQEEIQEAIARRGKRPWDPPVSEP